MQAAPKNVTASLVSEDGATLFATSTFREVAGGWARYTADLLASADTNSAQLLVGATLSIGAGGGAGGAGAEESGNLAGTRHLGLGWSWVAGAVW